MMGANGSRRRNSYRKPKYEYAETRRRYDNQRSMEDPDGTNRRIDEESEDIGTRTTLQTGTYYVFGYCFIIALRKHTSKCKYLQMHTGA